LPSSCLSSCFSPYSFFLPFFFFFFNETAPTDIYTLSLHDALPISEDLHLQRHPRRPGDRRRQGPAGYHTGPGGARHGRLQPWPRSEEHTSELQSRENLVCRLLLEKKKKKKQKNIK